MSQVDVDEAEAPRGSRAVSGELGDSAREGAVDEGGAAAADDGRSQEVAATPTPPAEEPAGARASVTTSAPAGLDAPLAVAGRSALWRRAGLGLLVILAFIVGLRVGSGGPPATSPEAGAGGPAAAAASAAKEVIWTCSMHPQIRMREPGLCPICGMDLIPASEGDGASSEALGPTTLTPSARALAKVRTSPVLRREPRAELRLLGRVDYDESSLRAVTAWTGGRIDRLRVRVTGAAIRKGQVIATLYSPEVYTATRDLVQATIAAEKLGGGLHSSAKLAGAALESARERLRLLGVSDDQIAKIERERAAPRTVEIRSPFAGTVLERVVEEGDYVQPGSALFNVADLSKVWIQIDAYEPDLPYLRVGQEVVVEAASLPDEALVGKVAFIDPVVDHRTRTAKVRIEVENRGGQLRPGVFAEALIRIDADERGEGPSLVIPASAPLFTGRRSVVYVEVPGMERPTYELREVRLGAQAGPFYPVLAGLSEGEVVVTRGAFVLDADLQLAGGQSMMTLPDDRASAPTPTLQVPSELREALRPVVATYLDAQTHLAGDAIDEAREDLVRLAEIVVDLRPPGPKAARDAWQAHASALGGHARHAAQGKDAADLRRAFEHLSAAIEELLETFGNPLSEPLRIAYCPMAFDSRGAAWVQRDDALANPYYGAAMLRCGEFRATVLAGELLARSAGAGAAPAAGGDDHGHHH